MNIELLDRIATWLEAGAPHESGISFNMNYLYSSNAGEAWIDGEMVEQDCGTACCIAGAALQFGGKPDLINPDDFDADQDERGFEEAAKLIGMEYKDAHALFYPEETSPFDHYEEITPEYAARVVRKLIKTGEVDWEDA